jgi:hypothetical protein
MKLSEIINCGFLHNRVIIDDKFICRLRLENSGSEIEQYITYADNSREFMVTLGGKYCTTFSDYPKF